MLDLLMKTMEQPPVFGTFHLLFLLGMVVITTLLIVFFRKCDDKTFRIIVGIAWVIIILMEIGKEIVWGNSSGSFVYDWNSFPFQFCSLPFYVWPLVVFLPKSKYKDALNIFVGTFMFFGGFAYMFIASSLCSYVFINIQTMMHHALQVAIGLFVFVHEYDNFSFKKFLQSIVYLVFTVIIAIILNVIIVKAGHGCNLFELNPLPGYQTEAIVFKDILGATNFVVYVLVYIIGFSIFACIFYFIFKYSIDLARYITKSIKKETKTN